MKIWQTIVVLGMTSACLWGQDSLSFGGVYDLPGAEVRAQYQPVSPLAQRFTIEEVYRLPGTFYDPARLVALLPGVIQTNDQANHLSVRGNSPNKNLWRLNGLAIVNPNHTANAGTFYDFPALNGGGVNAISAQMLDNSGFYSSGLPVEYGNATGGTFDLQLRPGSKTRHKQQLQAGFIGFDGMAEGPIGRSGKLSYLVNGRYSFTGLLGDAGVDFGGEEIRFWDGNVHLHYAGERSSASVFSVVGNSRNEFTGVDRDEEEPEDQKELFDIFYADRLRLYGANYQYNLNRGVLKAGAAISDIAPNRAQRTRDVLGYSAGGIIATNLASEVLNAFVRYESGAGSFGSFHVGVEANRQSAGYRTEAFNLGSSRQGFSRDADVRVTNISPYVGVDMVRDFLTVQYGIRQDFYLNRDGDNQSIFSPRINAAVEVGKGEIVFSATGTNQAPLNALLLRGDDANEDFGIAISGVNIDLSYARTIGRVFTKATAFVQRTIDEPAARIDNFLYSANNLLEVDPFLTFTEVADTRRYGLELEAGGGRKDRGLYYRGSVTIFNAETQHGKEGWSEDRFAADFVAKITLGREWTKADKRERPRTLGLNLALIARGGERYGEFSLNRLNSVEILNYFQQPDYRTGFSSQLNTYFRPDLRLYKTKTRPRTTTTLALDVQNVAGVENVGSVYNDFYLGRSVERNQLGLIPVLSYRIVWR
ncbi:TonB-dependent receptor plug domain-containing protein [Neolewinella antarctica]|uniref:TonB-dependent receptor n=1 Tax=Neolewinella antarctica TaxID=442734 RepID=A0ABX0XCN7_9BACT|nr:hypothetical protein [Neolewinella antarctica]NJC26704.1 hypothetical protein [Neolewinella antarctica]